MFYYISTKTMIALCLTVQLFTLAQVTHSYVLLVLGFTMLLFATIEGTRSIWMEYRFEDRLLKFRGNKS